MTAQQLKSSILQMAVQGKLVPQNPNDEPASVLLERIKAEKQELIRQGKIKKDKKKSTIVTKNKIPYELPDNWIWCSLSSIATVLGGKRIPAGRKLSIENTGHIYIRVSDMRESNVSMDNLLYVPDDIFPSISKYIINKEDIYITVAGTIGKVGKIPPELDGANLTENADRLVFKHINQDWLIKCMQSNVVQSQIAEVTTKVGQPKLAIAKIQNLLIPLPPLAEQKRIVAKIEELLPYIEAYEKAETQLTALNESFPEMLKKSILQEAVQGKLVPQNPDDEPAGVLLERIKAEKQELIKAGKIKKDKRKSDIIKMDEVPFEIPDSWEWIRFSNLVNFSMGKTPPRKETEYWVNPIYSWVSIADMSSDSTIYSTKEMVNQYSSDKIFKNNISPAGTLLMSFKLTVGKVSILGMNAYHNEAIISIFPFVDDDKIVTSYLFKILPLIAQNGDTKTAIKGATLNSDSLSNLLIPLPPLAEQKRIVSKIEKLMKYCDIL